MLPAMPQSTDATVKPAIAISSRRRRPMTEASQPVAGVAIAAATMYEVSTHEIWSCVADSEPCMFGSATFAIVVSSACISVASMTDTTSRPRLATSRWVAVAVVAVIVVALSVFVVRLFLLGVITRCVRSSPFGPFAARMFAPASCLRSPAEAGVHFAFEWQRERSKWIPASAGMTTI